MKHLKLIAPAAAGALLCATSAWAQESKRPDSTPPAAKQQTETPSVGKKAEPETMPGAGPRAEQPKSPAQKQAAPDMKEAPGAAKKAETPPKAGTPKSAETPATPGTPKSAETPPKSGTPKSAETPATPGTPKSAETPPKAGTPKSAETPAPGRPATAQNKNGADAGRVQLSSQQRVDIHRDILKEKNVNRVNVNVQIRVGERVPRSVRLAPLPAAVISIAPQYRSYRYFVSGDEIVIVEPTSYAIVDVITERAQTAGDHHGLTLSAEERQIVLREVDTTRGNSTLGLGAVSEGTTVPRGVELHAMPVTVVERVPKLQGYKYFVAENRLALVSASARIELILDTHHR